MRVQHFSVFIIIVFCFSVLDGKLLVLSTIQTVHQVCRDWLEELPSLVCSRERPEFYVHAIRNARRKMEDRHSVCVDLNTLYGLKVLKNTGDSLVSDVVCYVCALF